MCAWQGPAPQRGARGVLRCVPLGHTGRPGPQPRNARRAPITAADEDTSQRSELSPGGTISLRVTIREQLASSGPGKQAAARGEGVGPSFHCCPRCAEARLRKKRGGRAPRVRENVTAAFPQEGCGLPGPRPAILRPLGRPVLRCPAPTPPGPPEELPPMALWSPPPRASWSHPVPPSGGSGHRLGSHPDLGSRLGSQFEQGLSLSGAQCHLRNGGDSITPFHGLSGNLGKRTSAGVSEGLCHSPLPKLPGKPHRDQEANLSALEMLGAGCVGYLLGHWPDRALLSVNCRRQTCQSYGVRVRRLWRGRGFSKTPAGFFLPYLTTARTFPYIAADMTLLVQWYLIHSTDTYVA